MAAHPESVLASPAPRRPAAPAPPGRARAVLRRTAAIGIFLVLSGIPLLRHFAALEPLLLPLRFLQNETFRVGSVILGPYPHGPVLARLKEQGVEEIVILLNPGLPQERSLIRREMAACRRLDLKCTSMPLSFIPRVHSPQNYVRAAVIARYVAGRRVYVHCYLGMHRAILVAETLEGLQPITPSVRPAAPPFAR